MPIMRLCPTCATPVAQAGRCQRCETARNAEPARQARRRIPRAQRQRVYARDGYACRYCGATTDLTLDHLRPLADEVYVATDDDFVTACRSCNSRRGRGAGGQVSAEDCTAVYPLPT